ncbi:hypothetical protein E1B28_002447 [Marasmius oreades]|uniref:Uncharacterized protein n=1 Tax=Marasmius oreades TaxID=181124 RepID=A0A9P7RNP0_9AGAR|nr:uncharacterized protein E1B28_002447 [Marasmius oreades]KAG7086496.1 hypothetical protein E1B28_002447 [Marasmius oreades]
MTTRRIRFAPLPDPRRSVILTDDGKEHPLPDNGEWDEKAEWSCIPESLSLAIIGLPPTPTKTTTYVQQPIASKSKKRSSLASFLRFSHSHSHSSSPSTSPESSPNAGYESLSSSSSNSSIHTLTPTQSNDNSSPSAATPKHSFFKQSSATLPLNFGSGLFRPSSRDSPSSNKSRSAAEPSSSSLSRWTSGPSKSSPSSPPMNFGVPLYRTQSTQSYKKSKRLAEQARASGLLSSLHSDKTRGGQKLLNGRVYGAKRNSKGIPVNHFNSIRDTDPSEPEFVEWGYGGMGAVRHQKDGVGGKVWSRLAAQADDESADGGGMEWVRKRREAREREKKEREEAADQAQKQEEPTPPRPTPITPTQSMIRQVSTASSTKSTPTPSRQQSLANDAADSHVTRAVKVPAPVYRHHHHHRKQSSLQLQAVSPPVEEPVITVEEPVEMEMSSPITPPSFSTSSSSEDEDSEEDTEGREGDEDEEDVPESDTFRMTSRSAGVEKVSGHGHHR